MNATHVGLAVLAAIAVVAVACATGGGPDGSDAGGEGGACPEFDLQNDAKHCGSCTKACAATEVCSAGACKGQCDPPTVKCGTAQTCSDLGKDPGNCGQCGTACALPDASLPDTGTGNPDSGIPVPDGGVAFDAGTGWSLAAPLCDKGKCGLACDGGTLCSDDLCWDTPNAHDHCGDCNTKCAAGEWCRASHCCAPGKMNCAAVCIDVLSDPNNCGGCGVLCSGGKPYCANGTCTAGCVPSGTRQPFNSVVSSTTTGCWNGTPCGQDTVVLTSTYGKNFAAVGQELVCGGTTACVGHVGIGTYSSICQGTWDVYCNATKVGTLNTLNKVCVGTAMTNGCNIAFTPMSCSTLRLVATAGSGQTCCGTGGPDAMITAVSAW